MNESDQVKISQFIDHLLANPSIRNDHLIAAESQIINFISQNAANLEGTFKTPQFFPHLDFKTVMAMILTDLGTRVQQELLPELTEYINTIDFSFMSSLTGNPVDVTSISGAMTNYISDSLSNPEVRLHYEPVTNVLDYRALDRYIPEIFNRRGYLYNELVRVQSNNLDVDEYLNYLKTLMLLKNVGYRKVPLEGDGQKINIVDVRRSEKLLQPFVQSLRGHMSDTLSFFPHEMLAMAVKSNLPEDRLANEDASARFLFILTGRFINYQHVSNVDRGAESPDKSWFSVAKKNADHYGYNKRMLEDLFMIAADNNW